MSRTIGQDPANPVRTAFAQHEVSGEGRGILAAFAGLRAGFCPWLLDSALRSDRLGSWSFAGADPYLVLRAWGPRVEVWCRRAVHPGLTPGRRALVGDPLEVARSLLPRLPDPGDPSSPFVGGAVGFLGYELAQQMEPIVLHGLDDLGLPDLTLLFVDRLLAFDHEHERLLACALGFDGSDAGARESATRAAAEYAARVESQPRTPDATAEPDARVGESGASPTFALLDESSYGKAVEEIREEIAAGNVYQACLTHRIERSAGDPWALYRRLRRINPAPFASYLELPDCAVVGSSPERFLRLGADGAVESRPIKGTRPRGRDAAADEALRRELSASEKDRAENLMIVDLVRNDLGRVCETGSVHVPELMAIEAYASVFQMVSTVRGRLRADLDVFDLVRAAFPPGSMTGAPKLAAMKILDRLEPRRRGIYSGAIGYFDVRGGADLSVVIRTLVLAGGAAHVHTGGGIVADSEPAAEWRETLDKVRPLLAALGDDDEG